MSYMKCICERCGEEYIGKGNGKICEDCHRDITNMRLDRIDWFKCKDRTIRREIRKLKKIKKVKLSNVVLFPFMDTF